MQETFEIYTDGSLKKGRGSWAYVIVQSGLVIKEASGRAKKTTCNRMEFQAAIEALQTLPPGSQVTLYTDSRNLIDTVTIWSIEWKQLGWIKKNSRSIPCLDLILILDALNESHQIEWRWVRAHSGVEFNERCDQLCIDARTAVAL
jgi:ribonuclease HI